MNGGIRIGTVTEVKGRQVRVLFPADKLVSGWLTVVKHKVNVDGTIHDTLMPSIGDVVLCLYDNGFNADGYVIGGL